MDATRFMEVMSGFPSGVTIVTATDASGRDHGLTLTAFSSISTQPPLVMVSLLTSSNTLRAVRECGGFTVNFLHSDAEDVAKLFASKQEDKFDEVPASRSDHGGPILHQHASAFVVCRTVQEVEVADHVLFIGSVVDAALMPDTNPLLYGKRRFAAWQDTVPALV